MASLLPPGHLRLEHSPLVSCSPLPALCACCCCLFAFLTFLRLTVSHSCHSLLLPFCMLAFCAQHACTHACLPAYLLRQVGTGSTELKLFRETDTETQKQDYRKNFPTTVFHFPHCLPACTTAGRCLPVHTSNTAAGLPKELGLSSWEAWAWAGLGRAGHAWQLYLSSPPPFLPMPFFLPPSQ